MNLRILHVSVMMLFAVLAGLPVEAQDDLSLPTLRISWEEFKKLYDAQKVVVVDVRGDAAYAAGHIPRARSIPLDNVQRRAEELKRLKLPVVLYCA